MGFTMEVSLQQHMQPQCKINHLFPLHLKRISLPYTSEAEAISKGAYLVKKSL